MRLIRTDDPAGGREGPPRGMSILFGGDPAFFAAIKQYLFFRLNLGATASSTALETTARFLLDFYRYTEAAGRRWNESPGVGPSVVVGYIRHCHDLRLFSLAACRHRTAVVIEFFQWARAQGLVESLPDRSLLRLGYGEFAFLRITPRRKRSPETTPGGTP